MFLPFESVLRSSCIPVVLIVHYILMIPAGGSVKVWIRPTVQALTSRTGHVKRGVDWASWPWLSCT